MFERTRAIYRQSKKRNDNLWTEWVSRPPAALVVQALEPTRITPNQVTFLSIALFALAAAAMVLFRTWPGLLVAVLLTQLSYVLDCADGQLARLKQQTSPAGALLDFLMDEVKAFLLVGAVAARLWALTGQTHFLLLGLGGLVVVATGISLTTFTRTPEYRSAVGLPPMLPATDRAGFMPRSLSPVALVEAAGRLVLHYPSWIVFIAIADRLDIFLYAYLSAHLLYVGRASLSVLLGLGRPARNPPTGGPPLVVSPPTETR
jgi:phosphatidylglycerophosphate synthase